MTNKDYSLKPWLDLVKGYKRPQLSKSVTQLVNSFVPFIAVWVVAYFALQVSFWLMLPFAVIAGLFVVRIFVIQHDCGHGSFLKNRKIQDKVGFVCSIVSCTPYDHWKMDHAIHHAHSGDLDHRDIGEIDTYTVDEYLHLSPLGKVKYRVMRNSFVLFLIAPFILFVVLRRFPSKKDFKSKRALLSIWDTNVALVLVSAVVMYFIGWKAFLLIQGITMYVASSVGVWLFYVQHQFEDGYWDYKPEWNLVQSAIHGSSYFKLPKVLQWFSGNIGFHHIHHLSPQIPNYELERCHNENPIFDKEVTTLTLRNCWQTMKLRFWDEENKKLVSVRDIKKHYQPRLQAIQTALEALRKRQESLVVEAKILRKKLSQYAQSKHFPKEYEIKKILIQKRLKTLSKLAKRRSEMKSEKISAYKEELQQIKTLLQKYFPTVS